MLAEPFSRTADASDLTAMREVYGDGQDLVPVWRAIKPDILTRDANFELLKQG